MNRHFLWPAIVLCLCACKGDLALLGRNAHGRPIQALINGNQYQSRLVRGLGDIEDSILPTLKENTPRAKNWEMQLLVVGVGLDAEAGLGPFKVGLQPGIRAFFTNTDTPPPLP